jgi:DNA replication and repair protein RecF
VHLRQLWLTDFRNHRSTALTLPAGLTVITGANGEGKTNLLEAVGWLATLRSFRGVGNDALVRTGAAAAVVRADLDKDGRGVLIEARLEPTRLHVQVNRQRLRVARHLLGHVHATVFGPDDLQLVKTGPPLRRRYLDDLLMSSEPAHHALRSDVERVIRQRNALLRQARGHLDRDEAATLEVWDTQLVAAGTRLGDARAALVQELARRVERWYGQLAGGAAPVTLTYEAPWRAHGLAAALAAVRGDELRRGVTLAGPHRDDVMVTLHDRPARSHASQGEQRSLALALRLAGHDWLQQRTGHAPVVLLDDVFSELDSERAAALVSALPSGQALLTTATGSVPPGTTAELELSVIAGEVTVRA